MQQQVNQLNYQRGVSIAKEITGCSLLLGIIPKQLEEAPLSAHSLIHHVDNCL
jgi:hypothetical protein